jgi:hypothetical protein
MSKVILATVGLALMLVTGVQAGNNNKGTQGKLPEPTLVQAVDATTGSITIGKKGAESQTYTFDKAFGRVFVNGKQADLSKVEVGMKVGVVANGSKATRIDADTYVPKTEKK